MQTKKIENLFHYHILKNIIGILLLCPNFLFSQPIQDFYQEEVKFFDISLDYFLNGVQNPNLYFYHRKENHLLHLNLKNEKIDTLFLRDNIYEPNTKFVTYDKDTFWIDAWGLVKINSQIYNFEYPHIFLNILPSQNIALLYVQNFRLIFNYLFKWKTKKMYFDIYPLYPKYLRHKDKYKLEKVKRRNRLRRFYINELNYPKREIADFNNIHTIINKDFVIIQPELHDSIYVFHIKNSKLDYGFNQKGHFFSDSLMTEITNSEEVYRFLSRYYDIYLDTTQNIFFRTYFVGVKDLSNVYFCELKNIPIYTQIFDWKTKKVIYEQKLKHFKGYTFPCILGVEDNKIWYYCRNVYDGKFMIYSIKLKFS